MKQGRNRGLPRWYKGKKILEDIDGSEIFERDGSLFRQRGLNVSRFNYDSLTDDDRESQINK